MKTEAERDADTISQLDQEVVSVTKERDRLRAELEALKAGAAKVEKHPWPNCKEVQCEQAHEVFRCVMELLGTECPDNIYVIGKTIRVMERIKELRAELERVTKLKDTLLLDSVDDDTRIRAIAAPLLGKSFVDGDSYGVPGVVGIAERLAQELEQSKRREAAMATRLRERVELCCSPDGSPDERFSYCSKCCADLNALQPDAGRDYLSREQVKPLVEALRNAHTIRGSVDKGLDHAKQIGL